MFYHIKRFSDSILMKLSDNLNMPTSVYTLLSVDDILLDHIPSPSPTPKIITFNVYLCNLGI